MYHENINKVLVFQMKGGKEAIGIVKNISSNGDYLLSDATLISTYEGEKSQINVTTLLLFNDFILNSIQFDSSTNTNNIQSYLKSYFL